MAKIFVAYRRKDSTRDVSPIVQHLKQRFGTKAVFADYMSINPGERFQDIIAADLKKASVLLVIMGDKWLELDSRGELRINDPEDHHRFEIKFCLEKKDCTVIPVLMNGATLPTHNQLPEELGELLNRNALQLRAGADYDSDLQRLSDRIAERLPPRRPPVRILALLSAAVIVLSLVLWRFAAPKEEVAITIKGWSGYSPLWVADKMNLCDGVQFDYVEVNDINDAIKCLDRGAAQIGFWLVDSHVIARTNDVPAVAILKVDTSYNADAMIAFQSGECAIRSDDKEPLRGKKIAYQKYDPSHMMLLALGGEPELGVNTEVKKAIDLFVESNGESGKVDAAIGYEPFLTQAEVKLAENGCKHKTHRPFTGKDCEQKGYPITDIMVVRADFLEKRPAVVKSIVKGFLQAVEKLKNKDEVAIGHYCSFMDKYAPKTSGSYDKLDFEIYMNEDQLKLADAAENRKFFFSQSQASSPFCQQLIKVHKLLREKDYSLLGKVEFKNQPEILGDASKDVLRAALEELE